MSAGNSGDADVAPAGLALPLLLLLRLLLTRAALLS